MLLEMMVAAVIGISFGNVWICIFMGFGTSAEHKSAGKWFIAGRFLGLMFLGSVISLLRFAAQDAMPLTLLIFGISTMVFGLIMLLKHAIKTYFLKEDSHAILKKSPSDHVVLSLLSFFIVLPGNRKGGGKQHHHHKPVRQGQCKKQGDFERK